MPPLEVETDDERQGVGTTVGLEDRFDPCAHAGAIAVAAIKYLVLEQDDRLALPIALDIAYQGVEFFAFEQRE